VAYKDIYHVAGMPTTAASSDGWLSRRGGLHRGCSAAAGRSHLPREAQHP
jgi:hypothetical protein